MTDQEKILESVKCDKIQIHNFNNFNGLNKSHSNGTNHLKSDLRARQISNSSETRRIGLTLRERRSINIDSICHLNWMIIIIIFTLINLYERILDEKCKEYKATLISFSRIISSITAIETTIFYLIWFFLTNSKYYHLQIIYDSITSAHIIVAILNMVYAIVTFLSRTCHETKLTLHLDLKNADLLHLLAYRYDLKIAGSAHIFLTIIIVFSAIHLTTKRSKFTLHYLAKRGLLTEYLWETLD